MDIYLDQLVYRAAEKILAKGYILADRELLRKHIETRIADQGSEFRLEAAIDGYIEDVSAKDEPDARAKKVTDTPKLCPCCGCILE